MPEISPMIESLRKPLNTEHIAKKVQISVEAGITAEAKLSGRSFLEVENDYTFQKANGSVSAEVLRERSEVWQRNEQVRVAAERVVEQMTKLPAHLRQIALEGGLDGEVDAVFRQASEVSRNTDSDPAARYFLSRGVARSLAHDLSANLSYEERNSPEWTSFRAELGVDSRFPEPNSVGWLADTAVVKVSVTEEADTTLRARDVVTGEPVQVTEVIGGPQEEFAGEEPEKVIHVRPREREKKKERTYPDLNTVPDGVKLTVNDFLTAGVPKGLMIGYLSSYKGEDSPAAFALYVINKEADRTAREKMAQMGIRMDEVRQDVRTRPTKSDFQEYAKYYPKKKVEFARAYGEFVAAVLGGAAGLTFAEYLKGRIAEDVVSGGQKGEKNDEHTEEEVRRSSPSADPAPTDGDKHERKKKSRETEPGDFSNFGEAMEFLRDNWEISRNLGRRDRDLYNEATVLKTRGAREAAKNKLFAKAKEDIRDEMKRLVEDDDYWIQVQTSGMPRENPARKMAGVLTDLRARGAVPAGEGTLAGIGEAWVDNIARDWEIAYLEAKDKAGHPGNRRDVIRRLRTEKQALGWGSVKTAETMLLINQLADKAVAWDEQHDANLADVAKERARRKEKEMNGDLPKELEAQREKVRAMLADIEETKQPLFSQREPDKVTHLKDLYDKMDPEVRREVELRLAVWGIRVGIQQYRNDLGEERGVGTVVSVLAAKGYSMDNGAWAEFFDRDAMKGFGVDKAWELWQRACFDYTKIIASVGTVLDTTACKQALRVMGIKEDDPNYAKAAEQAQTALELLKRSRLEEPEVAAYTRIEFGFEIRKICDMAGINKDDDDYTLTVSRAQTALASYFSNGTNFYTENNPRVAAVVEKWMVERVNESTGRTDGKDALRVAENAMWSLGEMCWANTAAGKDEDKVAKVMHFGDWRKGRGVRSAGMRFTFDVEHVDPNNSSVKVNPLESLATSFLRKKGQEAGIVRDLGEVVSFDQARAISNGLESSDFGIYWASYMGKVGIVFDAFMKVDWAPRDLSVKYLGTLMDAMGKIDPIKNPKHTMGSKFLKGIWLGGLAEEIVNNPTGWSVSDWQEIKERLWKQNLVSDPRMPDTRFMTLKQINEWLRDVENRVGILDRFAVDRAGVADRGDDIVVKKIRYKDKLAAEAKKKQAGPLDRETWVEEAAKALKKLPKK